MVEGANGVRPSIWQSQRQEQIWVDICRRNPKQASETFDAWVQRLSAMLPQDKDQTNERED